MSKQTHKYEVIVSNVGTVYQGTDGRVARQIFADYARQSRKNYGRAAGESVTKLCDDDVLVEYVGTLHESED